MQMKKRNALSIIVAAAMIILMNPGCKQENGSENGPAGMVLVDLSKYGKAFGVFVPDTNSSKLSIQEQSSGALEITSGKNFAISIFEQPADIALRKEDIKGDEVNKLQNFIRDEPGLLFWESQITKPEFHFVMNKKIGSAEYAFEDSRETEGGTFGKDAIEKMLSCCEQAKETPK
jgi:hypothetical protein